MPPNSEIEKLERRWKENPKGTVFAPYAEALRKHGEHDLAREVLRQGLELHPDHIPGNIVLGRCCLDLREDGPAEAAFTHVLDLDVENVIALKALADITERQGRLLEASEWLSRLISVDPNNDEARDQFTRVEGAREAAAMAITGKISAEGGRAVPPDDSPADAGAVSGTVEVAAGQVEEDTDVAIDAAMDAFDGPSAVTAKVEQVRRDLAGPEAETVPVIPVVRKPASEPAPDILPMELDLARMAAETSTAPPEGMEPAEAFTPPEAAESPRAAELLDVGIEDHSEIELRPGGASEFQSPDHSSDLLSLSASAGKSEFQAPDAAEELSMSTSGQSEFQTPSGSEELLARVSGVSEPPPATDVLEPAEPPEALEPPDLESPASWGAGPYTSGYAAVGMSPTQEFTTPAPVPEAAPELAPPAWDAPAAPQSAEAATGFVEEESTPAPAEVGSSGDLKLIFPDEPAAPEPPRRRISEEALEAIAADDAAAEAAEAPAEPAPAGEPELVVTESMAELYARQGHYAEAVNVYQILLARTPRDARLAERLAEVEAAQQAGRRRLSFVAVETGGESVESFFRALAGARPGSPGAAGTMSSALVAQGEITELGGGAPTRPASDPLSLSAIFGEESQPASTAAPPAPAEPPARPAQDAFSFDQFFGAAPGGGSGPSRPSGPRDEDLDQFQHWLKSLKR